VVTLKNSLSIMVKRSEKGSVEFSYGQEGELRLFFKYLRINNYLSLSKLKQL